MGRIILILLFVCTNIFATNYYVATDGNNGNPGTLAEPFLTLQYSCDLLEAGDTLFVRGGVYYITATLNITGSSGTAESPICVRAYASDHAAGNVPIIDAINGYRITVAWLHDCDYWKLWGLTFRNALQDGSTNQYWGLLITRAYGVYVDQCVSYNNSHYGFDVTGSSTKVTFMNCDSYNNCDTLFVAPSTSGGAGGGFGCTGAFAEADTSKWSELYCYNCRAWDVSDNAFGAAYGIKKAVFDNCWAIAPGRLNGDGRGFAMGLLYENHPTPDQYLINNCIAVYCRASGFNINSNLRPYQIDIRFYNNTEAYSATGFLGYQATDETVGDIIFRNNISVGHAGKIGWYIGYEFAMGYAGWLNFTSDHNSWNGDVTVTSADFVSVDTTGMRGARKADGSLPDIDFFKLASTSDLIDAGVDVGLDYNNTAPDLGWYEYPEFEAVSAPYINTNEPIVSRSRDVTAGGNMIYDGGGTISAKGVVYSQETDPTTADSIAWGGTGTDDFTVRIPDLTPSTTYYARAYATNETGTAYGATVSFTTPASSPVRVGSKLIKHGNYYIKH